MTLSTRISIVRNVYWPLIIGAMAVTAFVGLAVDRQPGASLIAFVVCVGVAVHVAWWPFASRLMASMMARVQAQMDAALDDGDDAARRRLVDELDEYSRRFFPRSEAYRAQLRVNTLATDEKWVEALQSADQMDDTATGTKERVEHDNLVAWCCAHAVETARAVGLARANADAPAAAPVRPYLLGTLGAALVLDGQHAAALAPLRDALALGGPRWAQAVRRYYLGEALAALGRLDEARAEWQQAVTIAPKSRWGRRAQERLAAGAPAAYR